jgi:Flp pilus assembly protein TadD
VVLALLVALVGWSWRRHPVVAFGACWAAVTLFPVSNILLPTGVLLAERTLLLPSSGAMLAVTGLLATLLPAPEPLPAGRARFAWGAVAVIASLGLVRSAVRQPVWRDDPTLFAQTAKDAPRSYKALAAHAVMLFEAGQDEAGEREYRQALDLYRDDPNMFADLGDWYLRKNRCDDALAMYRRVLELVPNHWAATSRTILCLTRVARLDEARRLAAVAVRRGDEGATAKLAYVDSLIGAQRGPATR